MENFFQLLGEIEIVFGLWAAIFLTWMALTPDMQSAATFLEKQNFTEPAFVFVVMSICSTRPILDLARKLIESISGIIPMRGLMPFFLIALSLGPLLGSFITEPAAMTITALLLLEQLFQNKVSQKLKYATLGLLFVNISIGGTLTPYAAPPVLMVANLWKWDLSFMMSHFGWKSMIAIVLSTSIVGFKFRNELKSLQVIKSATSIATPFWISALHLLFLALVVINSHHITVFILLFLFFLGVVNVTKEFQSEVKIKESLLVAFFLGGLVILGGPQRWWIEPLISSMNTVGLYLGAIGLTAFTDNAALTFLGAQVPNLSPQSQYALVAGAVVGGGLTVIANAPNPAGYGILKNSFGEDGISPWNLFKSALLPTVVTAICFWFL